MEQEPAILVVLVVVVVLLVLLVAAGREMNRRYAHAADVSIRCRPKGAHVRASKQLPNVVMPPNRIRCKRGMPRRQAREHTKATHGDIPNRDRDRERHTYIHIALLEMVINAFSLRELRAARSMKLQIKKLSGYGRGKEQEEQRKQEE